MNKRIGLFAGLTALFAMGSAHAQTCPGYSQVGTAINDATGHTFFLYKAPGITWPQAQVCVAGLSQQSGTSAHLATITSSSENQWIVDQLLTPALNGLDGKSQVWVGGFQVANSTEPGEGWRWVNNEGPFPGSNGSVSYSNWAASEPNNNGPNGENHLTLGRFTDNLYVWNDEGSALSSIGGFIVEYDTPRTVGGGCTTSSTNSTTECTTVEGQTLTFPAGTFTGGSSFTFTAYEFTDPRVDASGRCVGINGVRGPLTLFEGVEFNLPAGDPNGKSGKIVIPEYLCGSPKFLVIRALGNNITIPKGIVLTESDTPVILPDNLFTCNAPIPAGGNPQEQDVGVWQSLDATEMWENAPTSPVARFAGTAAELTTGCASTLIQTRSKSNFVVGLHIDFGSTVDFGSSAEYNEFVALTQYKISLVRQSVVEARRIGTISDANGRAMISMLDNAAAALTANDPVNARKKIQDFLKKVNSSTYSTNLTNPFNFNGDHLSRGQNILFTLTVKVIPFKPVL